MTSPLGLDLDLIRRGLERLDRARDLVAGILERGEELEALVNDPDDPVAPALEAIGQAQNGAGPAASLELAAGAEVDDDRDAPAPAPAAPRNPPGASTDAILKWLEAHPDEWHSVTAVARGVGLSAGTVKGVLYRLRDTSTVEHNGQRTNASRWRLDPGLAEELERPRPDDADPEIDDDEGFEEARGQDGIDPGAGDSARAEREDSILPDDDVRVVEGDGMRVDVKAELERLSGLAPPRRSAANPPSRPSSAGEAGVEDLAAEARRAALMDRIRDVLLREASTISELALALDVPRRDVAPAVLELVEVDENIVTAGTRRPRGETVYSNIA